MNFFNDFLDTWERLDEIYEKDFENGSDTQYYHFFTDLSDLVNSLREKCIYSNKNQQRSQLDLFAYEKNLAYICMTKGSEGKNRAAKNFARPLGISFKDLPKLCADNKQYTFSEEQPYSQFLSKTQHDVLKRGLEKGNPTRHSTDAIIKEFRDFELLAIGELGGEWSGYYFVSGGQGRTLKKGRHWYSKLFSSKELYNKLRDWFLKNMNNKAEYAAQPHMYYHFVDNYIGTADKENTFNGVPINTDGNKNKKYIPWTDIKGDGTTHYSAMNFTLKPHNAEFKEIIGIGPFEVTDKDGNILLGMNMVKPTNEGGYQPPKLFGINSETGEYSDTDYYAKGIDTQSKAMRNLFTNGKVSTAKTSSPYHMVMSKDTAMDIAELFSESEYRVYIDQKRDFRFKASDIASVVLPAEIELLVDKCTLKVGSLVHLLAETSITIPTDKESFIDFLIKNRLVEFADDKNVVLSDASYNVLVELLRLLQGEYASVDAEIIGKYKAQSLNIAGNYALDNNTTDVVNNYDKKSVKGIGNRRLVFAQDIIPLIQDVEVKPWNGIDSVFAKLGSPVNAEARLGAETLVLGCDTAGRKYILFVDNAHKTSGFFELPGGGLHRLSNGTVSEASFEETARQRLHFKGGITSNDFTSLNSTGKGLLLYEKETAVSSSVKWPWSYYKLFYTYYLKPIDSTGTDYSFDNRDKSLKFDFTIKNENGYECFLKWIPVDSLDYNSSLLQRYSNIFKDIQTLAASFPEQQLRVV